MSTFLSRLLFASLILSLLFGGSGLPVSQAAESCPAPEDITVPASYDTDSERDPYKDGFTTGCDRGIQDLTNEHCVGANAPAGYRSNVSKSNAWVNGCYDGHDAGYDLYDAGTGIGATCQDYADSAKGANGYTDAQAAEYYNACLDGYNAQQDGEPSSYCVGLTPIRRAGCTAGHLEGEEEMSETPLPEPTDAQKAAAAGLNYCGMTLTGDPNIDKGIIEGCPPGYNQARDGEPDSCPALDYSFTEPDPRKRTYNNAYAEACQKGRQYFLNPPAGVTPPPRTGGIVPTCDPSLPPNAEPPYPRKDAEGNPMPPCDFNQFTVLIKNIMRYLFLILIPIAALMIGWGGFVIMTAAGSPEKVKKGTGIIVIALTGIAIAAVSYLVIQFVFTLLAVESGITDKILK